MNSSRTNHCNQSIEPLVFVHPCIWLYHVISPISAHDLMKNPHNSQHPYVSFFFYCNIFQLHSITIKHDCGVSWMILLTWMIWGYPHVLQTPTCGLYHRIISYLTYCKSSWIPMQSSCHAACEAEFDYLLLDWPEACGRCKVHFDKARDAAEIGDPKNTMA